MRNEPVDVVGSQAGGLERIHDYVGDHPDRVLEYFASLHPEMADRLSRGRTSVDVQFRLVAAVGAQMRGQYAAIGNLAGLLLRLKHDGARTIAEQYAGAPVAPVKNSRECFRADH